MKLLVVLLQGFSSVMICTSIEYFYPPLFWHQDNCPFKQLKHIKDENVTKEFFMKVLPYTGMKVVCPMDVTVDTWGTRSGPFLNTCFQNLWLVDKKSYDNCEVNRGGKLLLLCNHPNKPKSHLFKFHPILSPEEPRFIPGKHYYFISTSRGLQGELTTRRLGGEYSYCVMYHLKLHIYVCDPKVEDCVWEQPRCDPPAKLRQQMLMINGKLPGPTRPVATKPKQTRKPTTQVVETKAQPSVAAQRIQECKEENETSIYLVMNFVLGGIIVFLIIVVVILVVALLKRSKKYSPEKEKPRKQSKQTVIYESVPVQRPPVNLVPIGPPHGDYLVYARPYTPEPSQHTLIRAPHHNNESPVFRFPDVPQVPPEPQRSRAGSTVPQRSRAGSTQVKSGIETDKNMDSVSV